MTSRVVESGDAISLGQSLAIAYEANPLVRWMFADDLSEVRLQGLFTALVQFGLHYGLVYGTPDRDGAAIWFPPAGRKRDDLDVTSLDVTSLDLTADTTEWTSGRRRAVLAVLAAARPADPYFYLDAVGVVPGGRRSGRASELLAPVLSVCDTDRIGAYLEKSDPANTNFYAHHGFEEIGPLPMPEDAPLVVAMWRSPRQAL
jgi:hypothetical protein